MSPAHRFLHADGPGFTLPALPAPAKMHPSEIALTLSADVLRLPYPPATRLVLAEIVSLYAANAGCCDASDTHFADRLTISRDTASRAVQQLEADGLVEKEVVRLPTGFYRTLTPVPAAIQAKAETNPYPQNAARNTQNAARESSRKMPVAHPQNAASPSRILPLALAAKSGCNIPLSSTENFHTLNDDAAGAAALGSEKKIGADFSSDALPAEATVSAPPVAAAPPTKLQLMRTSAVATYPAFVQAWDAAALANPDTYADYATADLLHYHTALLDWSNSNGKKKLDWLATIRASMRRDNDAGTLRRLGVKPGATATAPSQVSQRQANSNALRARYQAK